MTHRTDTATATAIDLPTFTVGATYSARSACDHDAVWTWTVVRRTAKFLTIEDRHGDIVRVGVKVDADGEWAMPLGRYSMAPTIRAGRVDGTDQPTTEEAATVVPFASAVANAILRSDVVDGPAVRVDYQDAAVTVNRRSRRSAASEYQILGQWRNPDGTLSGSTWGFETRGPGDLPCNFRGDVYAAAQAVERVARRYDLQGPPHVVVNPAFDDGPAPISTVDLFAGSRTEPVTEEAATVAPVSAGPLAAIPHNPHTVRLFVNESDTFDQLVERAGGTVHALWGASGWDAGQWPYVKFATVERDGSALALSYCEGDIDVTVCATLEDAHAVIDDAVLWYWLRDTDVRTFDELRSLSRYDAERFAWDTVPLEQVPARFRGPFSWTRAARSHIDDVPVGTDVLVYNTGRGRAMTASYARRNPYDVVTADARPVPGTVLAWRNHDTEGCRAVVLLADGTVVDVGPYSAQRSDVTRATALGYGEREGRRYGGKVLEAFDNGGGIARTGDVVRAYDRRSGCEVVGRVCLVVRWEWEGHDAWTSVHLFDATGRDVWQVDPADVLEFLADDATLTVAGWEHPSPVVGAIVDAFDAVAPNAVPVVALRWEGCAARRAGHRDMFVTDDGRGVLSLVQNAFTLEADGRVRRSTALEVFESFEWGTWRDGIVGAGIGAIVETSGRFDPSSYREACRIVGGKVAPLD